MASPMRRGKCVYLTLDEEAIHILHTLADNDRGHGKLISTLIRQEEWHRIEARRLREKLLELSTEITT
jgi:hypothetical protein